MSIHVNSGTQIMNKKGNGTGLRVQCELECRGLGQIEWELAISAQRMIGGLIEFQISTAMKNEQCFDWI
jgi:hypothetical protein